MTWAKDAPPYEGPVRRKLLEAIARLTLELGRPPRRPEIMEALGKTRRVQLRAVDRVIARAREIGMLTPGPMLQLTTAARAGLGLPTVAYLAWPVPSRTASHVEWDRAIRIGIEHANHLAAVVPGLVPVSPFFTPAACPEEAAAALAVRCDGVIVVRDQLLIERPDVAAARRAGVPVSVILSTDQHPAAMPINPWATPFLVPRSPVSNKVSHRLQSRIDI